MKIINLLIFVCFLATTSFASASALKNVREIAIIIEPLDEDATRCGITNDLLDASIRVPLSNSRIRISKESYVPDSFIYIVTNVLDNRDFCIINIDLSFNKYVPSERDTGQFWSKAEVMSIRKINVNKNIVDSVESMTKQFIAAWLKVN